MAEEAEHPPCGVHEVGAGAEDLRDPRRAQLGIVLRRDDAARDHPDVGPPGIPQVLDALATLAEARAALPATAGQP